MKRLLEIEERSELERPFPLNYVLRNIFVFCRVAVVDVDHLKSNQSEGYRLLEAIVEACASSGLVSLKGRFSGSKNVQSAIRTLFSEWKSDARVRERNREIYALMEENKFPNHLYALRDYVERYQRRELLEQSDSGPLNPTDGVEVQITILDRRPANGGAEYKVQETIMDKDILSLIDKKGFPQSFYDFCVFVKENDMTIAKEEKPVKEQDVIGAIVTCRRKRKKQKAEAERLRALLENYRE